MKLSKKKYLSLTYSSKLKTSFKLAVSFFLINWFILRCLSVLTNRLSYVAYIFFSFWFVVYVIIFPCQIFPPHHTTWLLASCFPNQGSNPCLLLWKLGVLTTGPAERSLHAKLLSSLWFFDIKWERLQLYFLLVFCAYII